MRAVSSPASCTARCRSRSSGCVWSDIFLQELQTLTGPRAGSSESAMPGTSHSAQVLARPWALQPLPKPALELIGDGCLQPVPDEGRKPGHHHLLDVDGPRAQALHQQGWKVSCLAVTARAPCAPCAARPPGAPHRAHEPMRVHARALEIRQGPHQEVGGRPHDTADRLDKLSGGVAGAAVLVRRDHRVPQAARVCAETPRWAWQSPGRRAPTDRTGLPRPGAGPACAVNGSVMWRSSSAREQLDDACPEADECAGAEGAQDAPLPAEQQEGGEQRDREREWFEASDLGHLEVQRAPARGPTSENRVWTAKKTARLAMTPTTAAMMPVSAAERAWLPRSRST